MAHQQDSDTGSAQWHPHSTVATVVEREGRFLMVEERIDGRLVYNQPAGHLEPNESLEEAALRETLEESAWEVSLTALLGIYQYRSPHNGVCYIRSCFIAHAVRHHPQRPLDNDIVRALWMDPGEMQQKQDQLRSPVVSKVVEDYLAGIRYPLQAIQDLSQGL